MLINDLYNKKTAVAESVEDQLPLDTLNLIDEYIAKVEPGADRNQMIQHVVDGSIHTSELEYALQDDEPGVTEGAEGKVVFSGTGADGGTYEIIQSSPTDFMIHANGKHIDTYGSLQRAMSVLKNEVPGLQQGMAEGSELRKIAKADVLAKAPKPRNQQEYDFIQKYRKDLAQSYKSYNPKKEQDTQDTWNILPRRNKGMAEGSGPVTHRIGLTVTDPNHPMVSKRKEPYQKSVRVTQDVPDREAAINQAIAHHRRKGYKVHDHHYIGTVDDEPIAEVSLGDYRKKAAVSQAGAKINKFFDRDDAAKVAAADQTIAKRERGLARADARVNPYTPPQQDAEKQQRDLTAKYPNIDQLVADAERNRDPYYDRAEGNAYYAGREAEQNYQKLKQIQRVIQGLNESLQRTQP